MNLVGIHHKMRLDLDKERLDSCDVKTFNTFIKEITNLEFDIENRYGKPDFRNDLDEALNKVKKMDYDYISKF